MFDNPRRIGDALDEVHAQAGELRERLASRGELPRRAARAVRVPSRISVRRCSAGPYLRFEPFGADDAAWPFTPAAELFGAHAGAHRGRAADARRGPPRRVWSASRRPRLSELLGGSRRHRHSLRKPARPAAARIGDPRARLACRGVGTRRRADDLVLTDAEIFGLSKQRRYRRKRAALRQSFLSELTPGDYVVHIDHGIGRFAGVMLRKTEEREREYLVLEYGPTRTGSSYRWTRSTAWGRTWDRGERTPSLTRLGTQEWNRVKARVKASAEAVARDLLDLYASREVASGRPFGPDTPLAGKSSKPPSPTSRRPTSSAPSTK